MIRICSPVFDSAGQSKGILVLNYLAQDFLNDLKDLTLRQPGTFALLNEDGYWIFNDNPDQEWLFMYPGGKDEKMEIRNPSLWSDIQAHMRGEFFINAGELYLVFEINPLNISSRSVSSLQWFLLNRIPLKDMGVYGLHLLLKSLGIVALIAILGFYPVWLILRTNLQRNLYRTELKRSALYDSLTRLPNRALLMKNMQFLLKEQNRYGFHFGLLFIDLDGFKGVNDTYGHEGGDILLKTIAGRMKGCVRESDMVARMGGDEFIVLLARVDDAEQCGKVAGKLLEVIREDVQLQNGTAKVGASIGITLARPESGHDANELIKQADNAMYQVKSAGKGSYQVF